MAVFAFYSDRKNTSEKMKRQSNRHMPTPFAEVWLTACRCLQRPLLLRAAPIAYHKLRQIARKHLCFFPEICKKREGKERGCFFVQIQQNPCRNGVVGGQTCAKGPETCVNRTCRGAAEQVIIELPKHTARMEVTTMKRTKLLALALAGVMRWPCSPDAPAERRRTGASRRTSRTS